MHDAHSPLAEVILVAGSVLALAYGVAGSGNIGTLVEESVGAVQVSRQGIAVCAGSAHTVDGHTGGTDLHGHGIVGIGLGLKHFSELHGLRVGLVDELALPLGAVRGPVGVEEDEDELVDVVVLPLDSDVAGLDGLAVDPGLVGKEAAVGLAGAVNVGFQVILVAGTDKAGFQRGVARELEREHAGGFKLGEGRLGERGQGRFLRLGINALQRIQLSGRAGDDGQRGHHQTVYEMSFHCFIHLRINNRDSGRCSR